MSAPDPFIISVPGSEEEARRNLEPKIRELGACHFIRVPKLQVGTLGTLVSMGEELTKMDAFIESVTGKISHQLMELLDNDKVKFEQNLQIGGRQPINFITAFEWDYARYNIKVPLKEIATEINQKVTVVEQELKQKLGAYSKVKGNLQAIERKATGSLLMRNLSDLVTRDHFVLDSEYITTIVVCVPRPLSPTWEATYHKLNDLVVPASSQLITQDNEYSLYTVTIFRKAIDDFKNAAREKRFVVRDFEYVDADVAADGREREEVRQDEQRKRGGLLTWCKVNFGEAFSAWTHVKILRVFVESVLRYGLPVNFQAVVIEPSKNVKKLRVALQQLYQYLDKSSTGAVDGADMEVAGVGLSTSDYYPYVNFDINLARMRS